MNEEKQAKSGFFRDFGRAVADGDGAVKGSLAIMGLGYFKRKQIAKGIITTAIEILFVLFVIFFAAPQISKIYVKQPYQTDKASYNNTIGKTEMKSEINFITGEKTVNDYDHSFLILLYAIVSIALIFVFIIFYMQNLKAVYALYKKEMEGKHINSFKEDLRELLNGKFHITLLTLPSLGVILMSILPLLVLVAIAFTDYDQNAMPPSKLLSWVGLKNFKALFGNSVTITFSYAFRKILGWTFLWAFVATFTCFIGGVLLAKLINSKGVKFPKMWRTLFIIAIAVPQFVTLLLVRNFFRDQGIVNTICSNIGLTGFLKNIGLVDKNLTYIPFLTSPGWAKFMIIMINIWVGIPYQMLIATGVLMNLPQDQMESARIDGANKWQSFWRIIMPYFLVVQGPALITDFVRNINNFNVIYLLTQDLYVTKDMALASSNAKEVDLLVTWLFRLTNEYYDYKMASVIGIIVFLICVVFTLVSYSKLMSGNREEDYQL